MAHADQETSHAFASHNYSGGRIEQKTPVMTIFSELVHVTEMSHKGPFTQAIFVAQFKAIFVALKLQLTVQIARVNQL